jgi:hypothetical protein
LYNPAMTRCRNILGAAGILVLAMACHHSRSAASPHAVATPPHSANSPPAATLERRRVQSAGAFLAMVNDYPLEQHVFVDTDRLGSVPPSSSATFAVPLGTHSVVCADSPDPANNPTSFAATFEAGYEYIYRLSGE